MRLEHKNIKKVPKADNSPNVLETRDIENVWDMLTRADNAKGSNK
jgi:hypothetical protein